MIYEIIDIIFKILYIILVFVVLISWIPIFNPRKEPIATFIKIYMGLTAPIRAIIPPIFGLDFSPIILLLLLGIIQNCIYKILAFFM